MSNIISEHIRELDIDHSTNRLKLTVDNGIQVFIRYNNYGEYSYVIQFSLNKFDQIRYDNFDDTWDVSTKPHHCHSRYNEYVEESPFIGDPVSDMSIMANLILDLLKN